MATVTPLIDAVFLQGRIKKLLPATLLTFATLGARALASTPSICNLPNTDVEKMICSDRALWKIEERIEDYYQLLLGRLQDDAALRREQKEWVKNRNMCSDSECIEKLQNQRLDDLFVASERWELTEGIKTAHMVEMSCFEAEGDPVTVRFTGGWMDLLPPAFEVAANGRWKDLCAYLIDEWKDEDVEGDSYNCDKSGNKDATFKFSAINEYPSRDRVVHYDFRNLRADVYVGRVNSYRYVCEAKTVKVTD